MSIPHTQTLIDAIGIEQVVPVNWFDGVRIFATFCMGPAHGAF